MQKLTSIFKTNNFRDLTGNSSFREGVRFVLFFALSRLALLATIAVLVRGRELSNDALIHLRIIQTPFIQFMGLAPSNSADGVYAPFLALLEGLFMSPLRLLMPDFYAVRLTFIIYEILAAFFFWLTLRTLFPEKTRSRYWSLLGFTVIPMGWMASVIMPQDEIVSEVFIILVAWLVSINRIRTAVFVCGLGVVSAKIFFLIPLLALILIAKNKEILTRTLIGFTPILLVYGLIITAQFFQGNMTGILFENYTPNNNFCINIWVILVHKFGIGLEIAKKISSCLALSASLLLLAVFKWKNMNISPLNVVTLITAMLLCFFALFSHVNPEYYIIVLPLLLFIFRSKIEFCMLFILMTIPWTVNFFYGIKIAMQGIDLEGRQGKTVFLNIYQALFPFSPSVMYDFSLWLSIFFTIGMAFVTTRRLFSVRE